MTVSKTDLSNFMTALLVLLCALVAAFAAPAAHAQLGRTVTNTATVTYDQGGAPLSFDTNDAVFVIEARRTVSTIEFFRYVAPGQGALITRINGSDYNPNGEVTYQSQGGGNADPFVGIGPSRTTGGAILDLSGDVSLAPATSYLSGELMIVRVMDAGQNGDPNVIETVVITVRTSGGDEIILRLYESGPDTGEFLAYVPSSRDVTPSMDNVLTAPANTTLTATYNDRFDATEVSVDTALVDPFGRIFDSLTGELINDVTVTIVDDATGQPAAVFGIDGVSTYPSTLTTGNSVTDSSGLVYDLEDGEFLFPLMAPGTYRLVIEVPAGYSYPSGFEAADFVSLPNAPFEIIGASYGGSFEVVATGPLNFDVPLDPSGQLVLIKSTTSQTASVGDTVGYTIEVDNRDVVPALVRVEDTLPRGMRYVAGTARVDGGLIADETVSGDGRTLKLNAGVLIPGEQVRITYAAQLTAGARPGEAVNVAVAVNGSGNPISNRAEAAIQVTEDLLRSRLTIIGRVAELACDGEEDWAKELVDGKGVEGVRLYMENGNYVVTDEDGLYHFEGVRPGAHVVQVDEATLPAGYEPMVCEDNSRYAGSAISKFVDAQGGMIWRANFYLRKTGEAEVASVRDEFDDATEYKSFGQEWLETADAMPRWVYPDTDRTPSSRSINIGIAHPQRHNVQLTMNGKPVPAVNFSGRDTADDGPAEISRWRGVDIESGENRFEARIVDASGNLVAELKHSIWHVSAIERARLVLDQSELIADGRTNPVIAVRLENSAGRPVHKGRVVQVDISEPFLLKRVEEFARASGVSTQTGDGVQVSADGVARIELEPTLKTGRVRVRVRLDNGREEEIEVWLTPEKRDWILVGLAEGSMGLEKLDSAAEESTGTDKVSDGRVAFFAKGMIRGDWLMTLAVDTAKRRGQSDDELFDGYIDPNAYYTLYGDRTYQYSEAESRYPLYVKLEKDTVQLLFGDYDTDLNDTVLGRYSRRMSGGKGVYTSDNISATGFIAETNQGFRKDEIAADGTSGIYRLTASQIVRNSETITLETRDRVRPDQVLALRTFTRWVDYEIDYFTGEVIFRSPVSAADGGFNPNVIVADYEVAGDVERNVTLGGRAAIHTADRRIELGATYVREDGDNIEADATGDVAALDFKARLSDTTELRAEVATSSRDAGAGTERAGAYLLEVERQSEALTVSGYLQEEEAGFGLGQQSSSTQSIRRVGADASLRLSGEVEADAGERNERFVEGRAYREENLDDDSSRDVVEAAVRQDNAVYGASVGLRGVREEYPAENETRDSFLLTASARRSFAEQGLTITASHEQPIAGNQNDEATLFPKRTQIGVDKIINDRISLNARHEVNNGANASGNNTIAGITVRPWVGAEVRAAADLMTQDSESRLGATLGVDQTWQINDQWSASVGATRRDRIDGDDDVRDVTPDAAISPLEDAPRSGLAGDDFYTSLYAGAGYRQEKAAASARIEYRDGATSKRWSGVLGAAREAGWDLSYGLASRVQTEERNDGQPTRTTADVRMGTAWRPRGEGLVVFNRLDARYENTDGEFKTKKLVNNLGTNWMVSERTQAALNWGIKYQQSELDDFKSSGITQLVGAEVRHDITRKIDIGFAGSALVDHTTNTKDYSFGPSIGLTPAKNVWVSVGYNFSGFEDDDFEAAEYTRDGVFVKLRVKFDQHTADGLLKRISPKRD